MEQHYQIVNLHNIIKTQEAKIHELRQELKIANEREEKRYGQFTENSKIQIDEKDKMILYLKEQLEKHQAGSTEQLSTQRDRHNQTKQSMDIELMRAKKKNIELEGKIKRIQNENQLRVNQLMQQNRKMNEEVRKFQERNNKITMEITELKHFHKYSLFEIAKRKETLLWVDKFTQYLENSEQKEKKTLQSINDFVIKEIESLRTNLAQMVIQNSKNEESIHNHQQNLEEKLLNFLKEVKKENENILQENQSYWIEIIRSEKQNQYKNQIKQLHNQLSNLREQSRREIDELRLSTKNYESERKTLVLGFQQLRSLTENKENNYRKQIKVLKQKIQELISNAENKDKQFQEQIKILSSQIQHISSRYYENIDFPIRKFNERIGGELELVKKELLDLQNNSILKNTVHKFEEVMKNYVMKINEGHANYEMETLMSHNSQIVENVLDMIRENKVLGEKKMEMSTPDRISEVKRNAREKSIGKKKSQKDIGIEAELQILNLREKANKAQYESTLSKKHLAKLHEYCSELEKKGKVQNQHIEIRKKNIQLQSENQTLKQALYMERDSHAEDITSLKQKINLNSVESESLVNYHHLLSSAVTRIQQTNVNVQNFLQEERAHFHEMKESMTILKTLLIRPMESFEILVKQFTQMSRHGQSTFSKISSHGEERDQNSIFMKSSINNNNGTDMKSYKQIINQRNEISASSKGLLTDLIRTIKDWQKQSSTTVKNKNNSNNNNNNNQEHSHENQENYPKVGKPDAKKISMERKIKEIQNMRLKDRQESINKIEKLSEELNKMNVKISKSATLKATLSKFENNLNEKIDEIVGKMQLKLDKSQIVSLKEDVIKDLKSKLMEANVENEGLRKQISLLLASSQQ